MIRAFRFWLARKLISRYLNPIYNRFIAIEDTHQDHLVRECYGRMALGMRYAIWDDAPNIYKVKQ